MAITLKPLEQQVMVITGATSGIGLVTARMAAVRGTKLVLAARNDEALWALREELTGIGARAISVSADVGDEGDVKKIASEAISEFGNFDTWVNNAGVSIYGRLEDVETDDLRRLFETNFWGTVYGSLVAARNLKALGGAIINVGSTLSDRAIPLQGMYCASKHAVKGFTDALRMELEAEGAPISLTLVKPSSIDTPYKEHAKNYMTVKPENPPPVYAPKAVAKTILHCAENPVRDVFVGAGGRILSAISESAPRLTDVYMKNVMIDSQRSDEPDYSHSKEGLWQSRDASLRERGGYDGHVAESSLYTKASLHPVLAGSIAAGAAVALGAGIVYSMARRGDRSH